MNDPTGPEYYSAIAHKPRPEDERHCPVCNGAGYVRHGELAPNQFGFGMTVICPKWRRKRKRGRHELASSSRLWEEHHD